MSTLRLAGFGTALVLAAIIGGTIIGSVAANTLPPVSSPTPAAVQAGAAASGAPEGAVDAATAGKYCQAFLQAYGDALGVEVSALGPAATKAAASTIAAALTAGDISQAQADRLTARLAAIQLGGCPKFAGRIGQANPVAGVVKDGVEGVAKALGLTPAELRAELKSGKDLKQIATEKGVPYATVTTAALAPIKAKLDAAVAAGTIKQAREDKILARLAANLADGRLRRGGPAPAGSAAPGG
jgi:hypothetical protein